MSWFKALLQGAVQSAENYAAQQSVEVPTKKARMKIAKSCLPCEASRRLEAARRKYQR